MNRSYEEIKKKLLLFVSAWQDHRCNELDQILMPDVLGHISVIRTRGNEINGAYLIKKFVDETPEHDEVRWQLGNTIIRIKNDRAFSTASLAVIACRNKKQFKYIAQIACEWSCETDWRMKSIRMDIQDFESELRDEYAEKWKFDQKLARLGMIDMPCIMPELDNPYYQIPEADSWTDNEKDLIDEVFAKYNFGKDNLMYFWVKELLADDFENDDKKHFIAFNKFTTQMYKYNFSCRTLKDMRIEGNEAEAIYHVLVPEEKDITVRFEKKNDRWQIKYIEGGK